MDPRIGRKRIIGKLVRTQSTPRTLSQAFQTFYSAKMAEGMRDRTLQDYEVCWKYFNAWLGSARPEIEFIQDITADVIRAYVNYMASKKKYSEDAYRKQVDQTLSPYTVALRLRVLRTLFNFLSNEQLILQNPMQNIKLPRFDKEEKPALTEVQVKGLLAAPDTTTYAGFRDRALMMLLADGGFRIQEALGLRTEHIDVATSCIHLPASMNKNRKPRTVPVSRNVLREILKLLDENQTYFQSDFLFLANYGESLKADHFRKRLKFYALKAGLADVAVSPHQFRSFFCVQFLLNGGDLYSLQRIVAHSSIETTRRYVRLNDDNIRGQHEKFSPLVRMGQVRVNKRFTTR